MKKLLLALVSLPLVYSCSHPIDIEGQGDVTSSTGRVCTYEDSIAEPVPGNCATNLVLPNAPYTDIYTATPRDGWLFDHWVNCAFNGLSVEFENTCSFDVPADAVKAVVGKTMPPLTAVFIKDAPVVYLDQNPVVAVRGACYPVVPEYLKGCVIFDLHSYDPSGNAVTLSVSSVILVPGASVYEVDASDNILREITAPTTLATDRLRVDLSSDWSPYVFGVTATSTSGKASDELEVSVEYFAPDAAPRRIGDDVPTEFNEDLATSVYDIPVIDDPFECFDIVATSLPATGFVERLEGPGQVFPVTAEDPKICTCCTQETLAVRYNNVIGQNTEVTLGYQATDALGLSSPVYEHKWIVKPVPNPPVLTSTQFYTDEDTPVNFKLAFTDADVDNCGPPCDETWQTVNYTIQALPPASEGVLSIGGVAVGVGEFVGDVNTELEWTPAADFYGDSQVTVHASNPAHPGSNVPYNFLITTRSVLDAPIITWENPNPDPDRPWLMCVPYGSDNVATVAPPIGLSVDDVDSGSLTLTLVYDVDPSDEGGIGEFCFLDAQTGECPFLTNWSKTGTLAELNALLNSLGILMQGGVDGFPRFDAMYVTATDSTGLKATFLLRFSIGANWVYPSGGNDGYYRCPDLLP